MEPDCRATRALLHRCEAVLSATQTACSELADCTRQDTAALAVQSRKAHRSAYARVDAGGEQSVCDCLGCREMQCSEAPAPGGVDITASLDQSSHNAQVALLCRPMQRGLAVAWRTELDLSAPVELCDHHPRIALVRCLVQRSQLHLSQLPTRAPAAALTGYRSSRPLFCPATRHHQRTDHTWWSRGLEPRRSSVPVGSLFPPTSWISRVSPRRRCHFPPPLRLPGRPPSRAAQCVWQRQTDVLDPPPPRARRPSRRRQRLLGLGAVCSRPSGRGGLPASARSARTVRSLLRPLHPPPRPHRAHQSPNYPTAVWSPPNPVRSPREPPPSCRSTTSPPAPPRPAGARSGVGFPTQPLTHRTDRAPTRNGCAFYHK